MIAEPLKWTDYFDRIYCFSFLPNAARRMAMERELARVGIRDSGIFSFAYTSPDPWERHIAANAPLLCAESETNRGFVNLGLATARILREALGLGHRRILLLEDDVRFLKSLPSIAEALRSAPWDWNLIQFDKFVDWNMNADSYAQMVRERRIGNAPFFDGGDTFLPSGACFAADRIAMRGMLDSLERNGPRPVDGIFGAIGVKRAVIDRNLAVQVLFDDALAKRYAGRNSHHLGYRPQGIDYSLYQVPEGYGYCTAAAKA